MRIETPPEAINREALWFGLMVGVIATTAMTLIGGINFLLSALAGVGLAVVVWFIVVQLGKEAPPPRGEGNVDPAPDLETPSAPVAKTSASDSAADDAPQTKAAAPATEPAAAVPDPTPAGAPDATNSAEMPEPLAAAREGGADDLKQIKGVGPKLEELLHSKGVYHFDQIAHWTPAHVAWMDENLEGFKGRVSRDNWIGQAKELAAR